MTTDTMLEIIIAHLNQRGLKLVPRDGSHLDAASEAFELRELAELACEVTDVLVANLIEIDDPPADSMNWDVDSRTRTIPPSELARLLEGLRPQGEV